MSDVTQAVKILTETADGILPHLTTKEKHISQETTTLIQKNLQNLQEASKNLVNATEDVKYMIKVTDRDQRMIFEIFQDCVTAIQGLVAQVEAHARLFLVKGTENSAKDVRETVGLINDSGRGVVETYEALASYQVGVTTTKVKNSVPVTIITGFLGSGKTTFLNYILTQNHGKRIAVIENEFGEVGIDDTLVKHKFTGDEEIFQMNNGCICCTVRGDLIKALGALLEKSDKFDYIMIETTGLADPAPIVQTFFTVPEIGAKLRVDGIITLVDAKHVIGHLTEKAAEGTVNEVEQQIAFADVILLNKTDLVSEEELEDTKNRIQEINRLIEVIPTKHSVVPLDKILNVRAFDLSHIMDLDPDVLYRKQHNHTPESDPITATQNGDVVKKIHKHGPRHHHATLVTSVGFVIEGECRMNLLNGWMGRLLRERGPDIYRMKGVLAVKDMEQCFVFQAVHMVMDGSPGAPWTDEKRINKLVFIGKNLNREELESGFRSCLV